MKTIKVLSAISFLLVAIGFCMPWLEFYGTVSGIDAVRTGIIYIFNGHGFSMLDMLLLFAVMPLFSALATWHIVFANKYGSSLIYILLVNLTLIFATWFIFGFTSLRGIYLGFYIMVIGIILLNCLSISGYLKSRKL